MGRIVEKPHHWGGEVPDPDKYYGFLYIVTNTIDGRKYIGRKFYHRYSRRKKAGESDWRKYTGSSKKLNEDIKELGKDNFKFEIFKQYLARGNVVYYETHYQHLFNVLTEKDVDGKRKWYNGNIAAIKFIPPEEVSEETRKKMAASQRKRKWVLSKEARASISQGLTGNTHGAVPCSDEKKKKISEANSGKKRTEAQRKATSDRLKGVPKPHLRGERYEAQQRGDKFFDGRSCKNCGEQKKYTSNGSCFTCTANRYEAKKNTCHQIKTNEERANR